MNNPMFALQDLVRRGARLIGWEIGEAIESVMWGIGIGCVVLCCALCACSAVAYQVLLHH